MHPLFFVEANAASSNPGSLSASEELASVVAKQVPPDLVRSRRVRNSLRSSQNRGPPDLVRPFTHGLFLWYVVICADGIEDVGHVCYFDLGE